MTTDTDTDTDIAMADPAAVLHCRDVHKSYRQGSEQVAVLTGVNLTVAAGEKLAIVGASGSGKSTLLNMLGGLDDPSAGEVWIQGAAVAPMSESDRARWRNQHLGFVYQFHHLLPEFSALENVAMPLLIGRVTPAVAQERARLLLMDVGLAARTSHKPAALSGGERQRVAIARALAMEPGCVLMDEPTGNLDPATAQTVLELLLKLNEESGISFVIVTHDRQIAARMDRVVSLRDGRLYHVGGAP